MSDWITWERCPHCGRPAAVGWSATLPGHQPLQQDAVEFDCRGGCSLGPGELTSAFPARHPGEPDL